MLLAYQCVNAQDYLVLAKGDTLEGQIKPFMGFEQKIQLIAADKKKNTYPIYQVKSYHYKGDDYHTVRNERGYAFMKIITPGYLSLYAFQVENQTTYDGRFLFKKDGTFLEVPNLNFKKLMIKFLKDCEAVAGKIDNGDLGKRELLNIVDEYNACIEGRTKEATVAVAQKQEQIKKSNVWDDLEEKVKTQSDFEGKSDALEMITEIKGKILKSEKVPNFLIEGLKNSLAPADVDAELEMALRELPE
jgi:hypothetical protein